MTDESYWAHSADAGPVLPTLTGNLQCDVAVIGGGITGLSAALHLIAKGLAVVVLDAKSPGWGSSGRNGGLVSSRFRISFPEIARTHGTEVARRMYRIGQEAMECVEETIEKYGLISAKLRHCGSVMGAHDQRSFERMKAGASWLKKEYGHRSVVLGPDEAQRETGSRVFVGGILTPNSPSLHPMNYVRGLVRSLVDRGIPIFQKSLISAIRREHSNIVAQTTDGSVSARQVIFATNAYSNMSAATSNIGRGIIPFRSSLIATRPLPESFCKELLPTGRSIVTGKRILRYYRIIDNRLVFGGRGASLNQDDATAYRRLWADALNILPVLADFPVEFNWSGLVALTLDHYPHIGEMGDRVLFAGGFNGSGVSMGTLFGKYLAKLVCKEPVDLALLSADRFREGKIPLLHKPGAEIVSRWYQLLDHLGR